MSLRIAVLSPVWFRVPPDGYGGIEWVVSLLADSLVEAGHDVTLFHRSPARVELPGAAHHLFGDREALADHAAAAAAPRRARTIRSSTWCRPRA